MNDATVLEAKQVVKRFGGLTAVNRVDLVVKEQTIASVIGPNGAGKTTFFNCITGFYEPEEGDVEFLGESLIGISPDRIASMGIARTYQNIRLFPAMTAIENILVGHHPRLKSTFLDAMFRTRRQKEEEEKAYYFASEILRFIGLKGKGDLLSANLPYGDQRRLEIGRALANQPKLLLLDEPTAGMNPNETEELKEFILKLRDERNLTILLIEHDMRVVMSISNQVSVLDYGTKIAEGNPHDVQNDPRVIEAYLGSPIE